MNRSLLVRSTPLLALALSACGGSGGGGGGSFAPTTVAPGASASLPTGSSPTPPPPAPAPSGPRLNPLGETASVRADLGGQSAPSFSLQDQLIHVFRFPGVPGVGYRISIQTLPPGKAIDVSINAEGGGPALYSDTPRTPLTTTVTAASDLALELRVFDPFQDDVTVTQLTVTPVAAPFDPNRFQVVLHVCGDSFPNLGVANNLATTADLSDYASQLLDRVNALLPPDVQVDLTRSGIRRLGVAQVRAVAPTLTPSGRTCLPLDQQDVNQISQLGIGAADPDFGRALDVFLVQDANPGFPEVTGQCECNDAGQGGVFTGTGPNHGVYLKLYERSGAARPIAQVASTLAHELGHFLSMRHTVERSFSPDDIPDSPASTAGGSDRNSNGILDADESFGPDASYVMYPFSSLTKSQWSPGQRAAMRAYLSIREH